jgi:hypothetical protein
MADTNEPKRGTIPTREFLADFRGSMTDRELREKYGLSARNFVSLIKALKEHNLVSQKDLAMRRHMSEQRDLAKESQFLSQLFICPNCSHPSPHFFETCPACGAGTADVGAPTRPADLRTPSGEHFFVEEALQENTEEIEMLDEKDVIEEVPETHHGDPRQEEEAAATKPGLSPLRSWLSKLKKK